MKGKGDIKKMKKNRKYTDAERYEQINDDGLDEFLSDEARRYLANSHKQVWRDKITGEYFITIGGRPDGANVMVVDSAPNKKLLRELRKEERRKMKISLKKPAQILSNIRTNKRERKRELTRNRAHTIDRR